MGLAVVPRGASAYSWGQIRKKSIAVISEKFIKQHQRAPEKCLRYTNSSTK